MTQLTEPLHVMIEGLERLIMTYAAEARLSLEEAREHVSCALSGDYAVDLTGEACSTRKAGTEASIYLLGTRATTG